ncbi:MAG: hypothetical protein ACOC0U_05945 [Desulfovibrionales bacterium]
MHVTLLIFKSFLFCCLLITVGSGLVDARTVTRDFDDDGWDEQKAVFNSAGQLELVEIDSNRDGTPERRLHYSKGEVALVERDLDEDGFLECSF